MGFSNGYITAALLLLSRSVAQELLAGCQSDSSDLLPSREGGKPLFLCSDRTKIFLRSAAKLGREENPVWTCVNDTNGTYYVREGWSWAVVRLQGRGEFSF
jgi:hypothetical protein